MTRDEQWELANKWRAQARKHEDAAREIQDECVDERDPARDSEYDLHSSVAEALRKCARDLLEIDQPKLEEIKF
ncbi:MAG TPA: hypothetical protein VLC51_07270 [Nitrospira sp.]|nr:hypothetical protein [Nitrospira sp.]